MAKLSLASRNCASSLAALSFIVSSLWKRRFSSSIQSPGLSACALSLVSGPIQSPAKTTSLSRSSESLPATGDRDIFSSLRPLGRPRWLIRMSAPPRPKILVMVGRALTIRSSLVILQSSSNGTLKSHRIRTLLPLTSISATNFLAIMVSCVFFSKRDSINSENFC